MSKKIIGTEKRGIYENVKRIKNIKSILWIFILCMALFLWSGAVWIHNTYGDLSSAMTNECFLNFFQNSRKSFFKHVFLPPVVLFIILNILQNMIRNKKKTLNHNRICLLLSSVLMVFSLVGASVNLDVKEYFARKYRLGKEQWYDTNRIVIHALGEIEDMVYTNSKEALENSYRNGERILECDFILTSDKQLVACHDWDFWYRWEHSDAETAGGYVPDFNEFMNTAVRKNFTPLSGEELVLFMKEHPDLYIITDTKDDIPKTLGEPL